MNIAHLMGLLLNCCGKRKNTVLLLNLSLIKKLCIHLIIYSCGNEWPYVQTKGWFPYDRGLQIAIRSAIVCDHMETTSAIVCDAAIVIADDRRR